MPLPVRDCLAGACLLAALLSPASARADDTSRASPPASTAATPPAASPPPSPPNTTWYKDTLGDALALGGVASVAVGAVFFVEARSAANAATSGTDAGWTSNGNTARTESILGAVFIGVGAAIFGGAQWRYLNVSNRGPEETAASTAPPAVGVGVLRKGFSLSYGATF